MKDQFTGDDVCHDIFLCRMVSHRKFNNSCHIYFSAHPLTDCYSLYQFHVPVVLSTGWCMYSWDMLKKIIHIYDPQATGIPGNLCKEHEANVDKIHNALFTCLLTFFSSWHVDRMGWNKNYPVVSSAVFNK